MTDVQIHNARVEKIHTAVKKKPHLQQILRAEIRGYQQELGICTKQGCRRHLSKVQSGLCASAPLYRFGTEKGQESYEETPSAGPPTSEPTQGLSLQADIHKARRLPWL